MSRAAIVGKAYEHACLTFMNILGCTTHVVGASHDRGVDLRGVWVLPDARKVPVIAQCKVILIFNMVFIIIIIDNNHYFDFDYDYEYAYDYSC